VAEHFYLGCMDDRRADLVGNFATGPAKIIVHGESPGSNQRAIKTVERLEDGTFKCGDFTATTVKEAAKLFWDDLEAKHEENLARRRLRDLQRRHEETPCTEMEEARAYTERMKRQRS
jgi:hypothetical protein